MDVFKKKWRKAVEKCKSMNVDHQRAAPAPRGDHQRLWKRSRSWPERRGSTPQGCFAVYVGPGRERFVVGAQQSGHPLFRALLEAAETEYGHSCRGPLLLPCDVDLFCMVLVQIDCDPTDEIRPPDGCGMAMCSPRGQRINFQKSDLFVYSDVSKDLVERLHDESKFVVTTDLSMHILHKRVNKDTFMHFLEKINACLSG